jgi:hypothetical protein
MHAPSNTQHVNLHEGLWSEHLLESLKRILHQCIRRLKNIAASTLCDMGTYFMCTEAVLRRLPCTVIAKSFKCVSVSRLTIRRLRSPIYVWPMMWHIYCTIKWMHL